MFEMLEGFEMFEEFQGSRVQKFKRSKVQGLHRSNFLIYMGSFTFLVFLRVLRASVVKKSSRVSKFQSSRVQRFMGSGEVPWLKNS
jgi:hypothetical protein